MICAYDGSRDVFHPLMFVGPMMMFIYGWMPLKLNAAGGLEGYFQRDQLVFVESLNVLGIFAVSDASAWAAVCRWRKDRAR